MIVDDEVKGVIEIHPKKDTEFNEEEMNLIQTLANNVAFAVKAIELNEMKRKAYEQIERNIEQFAVLTDHIRNPLAVISAIAEVYIDDVYIVGKNIKQIQKIVDVVEELEGGWVESKKIREFLRRHS